MRKVLRFVVALVGLGIGCGIVALVMYTVRFPGYDYVMRYTTLSEVLIAVYVISGFLFGLIFYILSPRIIDGVQGFYQRTEKRMTEMPALDIVFCAIGIMFGLLFAFLLGLIVRMINVPVVQEIIMLILYAVFGYFGGKIGVSRCAELVSGFSGKRGRIGGGSAALHKVLDTSAIIDGRILDVCKTGFVEGTLVVPSFVLKELRHIADSSDASKRGRGRRGLDIVQEMQQKLNQPVLIDERDYDDVDEVDAKLLRLAADLNGVLVTNDYNLNKVAAVQQTPVLNINELASAIRPVLLPGEELTLSIAKEGKEQGQGVGYLADGTMVIVENGRRRIGETVELVVTSALQTAAGRMIFAKIKG